MSLYLCSKQQQDFFFILCAFHNYLKNSVMILVKRLNKTVNPIERSKNLSLNLKTTASLINQIKKQ